MPTAPLSQYAVRLRPEDNIAVAARPVPAGAELAFEGGRVTLPAAIPMGHKFALQAISEGDAILKYGQVIGFASRPAGPGDHVHTHNVAAPQVRSRLRLRRRPPRPAPAPGRVPHLPRLRPRPRPPESPPLRHAQLPRHHQHGQLLRQHLEVHRRARAGDGHPRPVPERRRRGARRPQAGLRPPVRGAGPQATRAHPRGVRQAPQRRRVHSHRPGLRDRASLAPDRVRGAETDATGRRGPRAARAGGADDSGVRRHRQNRRGRRQGGRRLAAESERIAARRTPRPARHSGPQLRRVRRQLRRHRQPRARRRLGPGRPAGRHQYSGRDARDLRRGTCFDAPRRQPRGRRETRRAHQVVGVVHRHFRRGDQQQPQPRQQGGRADHDLREVQRRDRQGGQHRTGGRGAVRRGGDQERLRGHGHAPATTR